jgi:hypothetical protein
MDSGRSLTTLLVLLAISMFVLDPMIREGAGISLLRDVFFSVLLVGQLYPAILIAGLVTLEMDARKNIELRNAAVAVSKDVWLHQLTDDGPALELTAKWTKYYKHDDLNWKGRQKGVPIWQQTSDHSPNDRHGRPFKRTSRKSGSDISGICSLRILSEARV